MSEKFSYGAYLIGWKVVAALPEKFAYRLFAFIADYVYRKNGKSVRRLRVNLSIVKPSLNSSELEDLTKTAMRSYMRYWCDTFRIHTWSPARIEASVSTTNDHLLRQPMIDGRGVVIALPHSGNWDHAGAYFCQQGIPLVTVAEVLKPEALFKKFLEHRTRMGFEVLSLDSRAFVTLLKRAREKRLIALVADRDLSASGIEVSFFGRKTKMPGGPALLSIREGLPLVVAHVSYRNSGIHIDFQEIAIPSSGSDDERLQETVQKMAHAFEIGIAAYPEDWHMLQHIWIEEGIY
jgi:KDO2-lipid IV(A) lauroyltransferase